MKINEHLKKQYWKRRVVGDLPSPPPTDNRHYEIPLNEPYGANYRYLSQEDFMREIEPSAHDINSKYQSTRPIKELKEREIECVGENGELKKKTIKE